MSNDTQVQAHMALVAIAIQVVRDNALDRGASLDDVRRTTADVEASARQLSEQGAPVVKRIDLTADQLAGLTCKTDVQIGGAMPERDDFMQGIFVALQHVKADNSVIWREIVESVGVDDALNYAAFVEPAEWELAGFDQFAKQELGRTKPRKRRARPLTASPTTPPPAPVLSDAEIDAIGFEQWGNQIGAMKASYRAYARAIEQAIGRASRGAK